MVYEKSALGFSEFNGNKRTLNVRERQVLLLINGVRNLDDLEKFFKKPLLDETIEKLANTGFISVVNTAEAANKPHQASQTVNLTTLSFLNVDATKSAISPAKLQAVKHILLEASDDYLGLIGRGLKDKINQCTDESDLRTCVSSWHMAMRESKLGRESTDFLMAQIHYTLENNLQEAATSAH